MVCGLGVLPGEAGGLVGDEAGDGVDGLGEQVAAAGEAWQDAPPLQLGDGVLDRDPLRGPNGPSIKRSSLAARSRLGP